MFVHHAQTCHSGTERVGARVVTFTDGVAEVGIASVLARYRRAGYEITKTQRRPKAADATTTTKPQPPAEGKSPAEA